MTSNRQSGQGSFGLGNQGATSRIILWHVSRCRWLRRRRQCSQNSPLPNEIASV